jgi:hypothetical protein
MILHNSFRSIAQQDPQQERKALFAGMVMVLAAAAAVAIHALAVVGH